MRRFLAPLLFAAIVVLPILVLAQVPDPGADPDTFIKALVSALAGGQWKVAGVLGAIGGIYLLRTFGTKIPGAVGAFLGTSRGGAFLALLATLVVGLGAALVAGTPITVNLVLGVLTTAFAAIGGWVGVRRLLGLDVASVAATQFVPAPPGSAAAAADQLGKPPAP